MINFLVQRRSERRHEESILDHLLRDHASQNCCDESSQTESNFVKVQDFRDLRMGEEEIASDLGIQNTDAHSCPHTSR